MPMKRTELDKRQGLKIANQLRQSGPHHLVRRSSIGADSGNGTAPPGWYRSP